VAKSSLNAGANVVIDIYGNYDLCSAKKIIFTIGTTCRQPLVRFLRKIVPFRFQQEVLVFDETSGQYQKLVCVSSDQVEEDDQQVEVKAEEMAALEEVSRYSICWILVAFHRVWYVSSFAQN
jgi:hypothetical protein